MANTAQNIGVVLSANATSFKSQMAVASGAVKDFESTTNSTGSSVSKWGQVVKVAAAAAALAVAAVAVTAIKMAADFDRAMRNVNSISQMPEAAFHRLSDQVIELSKNVPQSATTLAEGLYDIASSGFQGAAGMEVLNASAKAASAGLSDTKTAARAIVAVLNAYGMTAADASKVSDVLFQTVNVGVISFEELASQVGDVVGIAAAAKISIAEVGAAIAAMTLSGISGAEATTSLNRVIQQLLNPSDALTNLMHSLGYESGYAMLQALGLHGTMEKLRIATGGNVEALLQLFPEIRSARGAFALMAADGANYAKTFAAIADETNSAGATQRAFNEQMKSLSAQWDIFRNRLDAAMITLGTKMIPLVSQGLVAIQAFGQEVTGFVEGVGERLAPFFAAAASTAGHLSDIVGQLASDFGPLVQVMLALVGIAYVAYLNTVATAIEKVTGFLSDHKTIVEALVILYGARWLASVLSMQGALGTLVGTLGATKVAFLELNIVQEVGLRMMYLKDAILGFSGVGASIEGVRTAFAGLGGVAKAAGSAVIAAVTSPTVAIAGFTILIMGMISTFQNAKQHAQAMTAEIRSGLKTNDIRSYTDAIAKSKDKWQENVDVVRNYGGVLGTVKATYEALNPFVKNTGEDAGTSMKEARDQTVQLNRELLNLQSVLQGITLATANAAPTAQFLGVAGQSVEEYRGHWDHLQDVILKLANQKDIDLTKIKPGDKDKIDELGTAFAALLIATQNSTPTTDALSDSFTNLSDKTTSATDKLKAYKQAMDAIIGVHLNAFDALTKWRGALDDINTSLFKNGQSFDENTKAGRDNREALSGAAKAAMDHAKAVADETGDLQAGNAALQWHVAEIKNYLTNLGLTPDAAQKVIDSLGLTEGALATLTGGTDNSAGALKNLQDKLSGVAGTKLNGAEILDVSGWKGANGEILGGVDNLQTQILQFLKDKKVLYIDGHPAQVTMDTLMATLTVYGEQSPEAQALLNYQPAGKGFTTLQQWIDDYVASNPTAMADLNKARFDAAVDQLYRQKARVEEPTNTTAYADVGPGLDALSHLEYTKAIAAAPVMTTVYADTGPAYRAINTFRSAVADLQVVVGINGGQVRRWGGIDYKMAGGGSIEAFHTQSPTVLMGERATGGEAFIPKLGSTARSTAVLARAAGWYGMQVVPKETMRIHDPSYGSRDMHLHIDPGAVAVQVNADAGVDGRKLESAVNRAVQPAFEDFVRVMTKQLKMTRR